MTTSTDQYEAVERDDAVAKVAERLLNAARTRVPAAPVRDLLGAVDIDLAYAVQRRLTETRLAEGARIVGRKIGLTSPAVQQQLGVGFPDFGVLFDDMDVSAAEVVPPGRLLQPKVEGEVAFVLCRDLDDDSLDYAAARSAVDYAVAAIEIVDSRVANWDIKITDTIADNASSGLYALGRKQVPLDEFEPAKVSMQLFANGDLVSEGDGAACLGDPLNALLWLAKTARSFGEPLLRGQVVLSGALGPMVVVRPGISVRVEISSLGSVGATFADKEQG